MLPDAWNAAILEEPARAPCDSCGTTGLDVRRPDEAKVEVLRDANCLVAAAVCKCRSTEERAIEAMSARGQWMWANKVVSGSHRTCLEESSRYRLLPRCSLFKPNRSRDKLKLVAQWKHQPPTWTSSPIFSSPPSHHPSNSPHIHRRNGFAAARSQPPARPAQPRWSDPKRPTHQAKFCYTHQPRQQDREHHTVQWLHSMLETHQFICGSTDKAPRLPLSTPRGRRPQRSVFG